MGARQAGVTFPVTLGKGLSTLCLGFPTDQMGMLLLVLRVILPAVIGVQSFHPDF